MKGLATTLVNKSTCQSVLLDVKHLLVEAKQQIPAFLEALEEDPGTSLMEEIMGGAGNNKAVDSTAADSNVDKGCTYCGGLGHRILACPKLETMQKKQATSQVANKDRLAQGSSDW